MQDGIRLFSVIAREKRQWAQSEIDAHRKLFKENFSFLFPPLNEPVQTG